MKVLVTGATGFIGAHLAIRLHQLGYRVSTTGRNLVNGRKLIENGLRFDAADLSNQPEVHALTKGQDLVFHCGAFSSPWGKYQDFYNSNLLGSEHVIQACLENNISRLIYVSTPSLHVGGKSQFNIKEDNPFPEGTGSNYTKSKLLAEQAIDRAFLQGLAVITIRPRAVFGPGDTSIFPRAIAMLKKKRLPVIGDGKNIVDLTYIDNVIDALLLCIESPSDTLGKHFNITNDEPVLLWGVIRSLCDGLRLDYPTRTIPFNVAYLLGWLMEQVNSKLPGYPEPPLTRFIACSLANNTTFDISLAKKELAYSPLITISEGLAMFMNWWKKNNG